MQQRVHKVLSAWGIASRRGAEEMVVAGRVTVNGETAQVGQAVDPEADRIEIDGVPAGPRGELQYVALNKPTGVVSTTRSTHGEPTVVDLLPAGARLFPVGRLDKDTSGLLLLTNDGEWANLITHPRYEVEKEYEVAVRGVPRREDLDHLRSGVELPGGSVTAPARVHIVRRGPEGAILSVTVIEGKKRQIRLMTAAVGHPVLALRRVRVGPLRLGTLEPGCWRRLSTAEVEEIRADAGRIGPGSRRPADAHHH